MGELVIYVCLKSVPDPQRAAESVLDAATGLVKRNADALGIPRVISPLDRNALEEALRIKEALGGRVTVLTMDTPAAEPALRQALALGADQAVLLSDRALAGADSLATARTLVAALRRLGDADLVLCGAWSYHGNTGQVGPQVAELLGIAHLSFVAEMSLVDGRVHARCALGARYAVVKVGLPLLVTVVPEINTPRHVSLLGIVQARQKSLRKWGLGELGLAPERVGLAGSPSRVQGVSTLPSERRGQVLAGDGEDAVQSLLHNLREQGVL